MKHPERLMVETGGQELSAWVGWRVLVILAVLLAIALIGRPIADALR